MREMTDSEVREVCFDILKYIKKICDENGIKYSLTGGTLLGAVRHHGFIPWDDDCDVFLARPEYEKLKSILRNQDEYQWIDHEINPDYYANFGRLIDKRTEIVGDGIAEIGVNGIFVDVCVIDGLPDNKLLREMHIAKVRFLTKARNSSSFAETLYVPGNPAKRIVKSMFQKYTRAVGAGKWTDRLEKCVKKYSFDTGKYVGNIMSHYGRREVLHRSGFDNYIELEFEKMKFLAFEGHIEYLEKIYGGGYMTPPPEDKRGGHRVGRAYWRHDTASRS